MKPLFDLFPHVHTYLWSSNFIVSIPFRAIYFNTYIPYRVVYKIYEKDDGEKPPFFLSFFLPFFLPFSNDQNFEYS